MALACFRAASFLAVTAGLGMTAGCIIEDDPAETVEQALGGASCPFEICGSNNPVLSLPFFELYEGSAPNEQGLTLDGIYFGAIKWKVDVVGNQLTARNGALVKSGLDVQGGKIRVKDAHGTVFQITVDEVIEDTQLYPPGSGTTWSYVLTWRVYGSRDTPVNLCSDPESLMGEQDTLYQYKYSTVLFEGERYDEDKLMVRERAPTADWFNLGCAGHLLAKMHLTHHTQSSSTATYPTNVRERDAMMKMVSADYCGIGEPFTVGGTPLSWTDDHGWLPHVWDIEAYDVGIEARFGPSGATCLEKPRLAGTTDPAALAEFGNDVGNSIWHLIEAKCALPPPCSTIEDNDVEKTWNKHLVSGNPQF